MYKDCSWGHQSSKLPAAADLRGMVSIAPTQTNQALVITPPLKKKLLLLRSPIEITTSILPNPLAVLIFSLILFHFSTAFDTVDYFIFPKRIFFTSRKPQLLVFLLFSLIDID